jgi:hypothetical protein
VEENSKKSLILILVLTLVFGVACYMLAKKVDKDIANVSATKQKIDELSRYAVDQKARIEEYKSVAAYQENLTKDLAGVDDIIDMLEQLETVSQITKTKLSIKLEQGVIGGGKIEFKDEKEKAEFLKSISVKEYTQPQVASQQGQQTSQKPVNVALTMQQQATQSETSQKLKINYIEIDLSISGGYDEIRSFLQLMDNSRYIFNIKEIRLNKVAEGNIDALIRLRAFIFEQ